MAVKLTDPQKRALADIVVGGLSRRHAFWQHRTSDRTHRRAVVDSLRARGLLVCETLRLSQLTDGQLSLYGRRQAQDACRLYRIEIPEESA